MAIKNRIPALVLLSGCLAAGNALAVGVTVGVTGGLIYQKADRFISSVHLTDSFMIDTRGIYQATFTDFKSASAFESSSMDITNSIISLGGLTGPGSFTFGAGPGEYNVSMHAEVGAPKVSAEEKQRLMDEEHKRRGKEWWRSLTKEERQAQKDLWKSWSKEEMREHQKEAHRRTKRRVEEQLAAMNTGQYGIEISAIGAEVSAVPLPAAAWLFGSGMLALAGFGRLKAKR